jgi:AraC-like DNA-binding protein
LRRVLSVSARSVAAVLDAVRLCRGPAFTVARVVCAEHRRGWTVPEVRDDVRLVLVREGVFRRRVGAVESTVDPTVAYLGVPGEEERFAHPAGGDRCTSLSIDPRLWRRLAGEGTRPTRPDVYVDARLDLAHRRLLAAVRDADPGFAAAEGLLALVAVVLARAVDGPTPVDRHHDPARAALVARAREAIAADHPAAAGLWTLADLLAVSPYRLSRAFTHDLGVSVTHYRNRVRVGRALVRIEEGTRNLSALAAELGFADHAHLTRTMRAHLGHTPTAVRRLLNAG